MKLNLFIRKSFKDDFKEAKKKNLITPQIDKELDFIIECLLNRVPLETRFKDHPLKGDFKGFRDCHIKSDFVLIYQINDDTLELVRLGRHLDIFKNKK